MKEFDGRTTDVEAPFLSGEWWKEGVKIVGVVSKVRSTEEFGRTYTLDLREPVIVEGAEEEKVCMGNLTGFRMALEAMGLPNLILKDVVTVECVGFKPAKQEGYSARPNFHVHVVRP